VPPPPRSSRARPRRAHCTGWLASVPRATAGGVARCSRWRSVRAGHVRIRVHAAALVERLRQHRARPRRRPGRQRNGHHRIAGPREMARLPPCRRCGFCGGGQARAATRSGGIPALTASEAQEVIERHLAHWLAERTAEPGVVVYAPPHLTTTLCYYGGLRGSALRAGESAWFRHEPCRRRREFHGKPRSCSAAVASAS